MVDGGAGVGCRKVTMLWDHPVIHGRSLGDPREKMTTVPGERCMETGNKTGDGGMGDGAD